MDAQIASNSVQEEFKWLVTIFQNILHNQQIEKYRNLNFNRICKVLGTQYSMFLTWLYNAGFQRSHDGKRLVFDTNKLDQLKEIYASLLLVIGCKDKHQNQLISNFEKQKEVTLKELVSVGFTEQEAMLAIKQSLNDYGNEEKYDTLNNIDIQPTQSIMQNVKITKDLDDTLKCCLTELQDHPIEDLLSNALDEFSAMQLNESAFHCNDTNISSVNSLHLFHPCNLYPDSKCTELDDKKTNNVLLQCLCLRRICEVLMECNVCNNCNIQQTIYDTLGNGYSDVHLLNDFNHLIHYHSTQFEDIYKIFLQKVYNNKPCNLSKCLLMRRNQRDRIKTSENMLGIVYFTNNNNEIVTQQFVDRIHCHYFHSFDIGYKISKEERQCILNETKIKDNVDEKHNDMHLRDRLVLGIFRLNRNKKNKYRNVQGLERIYNQNNKYTICEQKTEQFIDTNKLNEYQFGFRFFYHKFYKNNTKSNDPSALFSHIRGKNDSANHGYSLGQMYIAPKYSNFQQELKKNDICVISAVEWDFNYKKAQKHIETNNARKIHCPRTKSAEYYDMKYGSPITVDHIIAMMVYCNYDILQRKFTETFRRMGEDESVNDIKQKHSNYHFLAKFLRECVECFGMEHKGASDFKLYSGVNQQFKFESIYANIKAPFSTTTDCSVAVNFSGSAGMILEMNIHVKSWLLKYMEFDAQKYVSCFDTFWLSDFPNESEIFCLGGLNEINFVSITETSTGINYGIYMKGLAQMTSIMGSKDNTISLKEVDIATTVEEKQMVFRLLSHRVWKHTPNHKFAHEFKSLPPYFQQIVDAHCKNIVGVEIDKTQNDIFDRFFKLDNGWINLEMFTKTFPNVRGVSVHCYDKPLSFLKDDSIYKSILTFIKENKAVNSKNVDVIMLYFNKEYEIAIKQLVQRKYEAVFKKCGWEIRTQFMDPVKLWFPKAKDWINTILTNPMLRKMALQTAKTFECFTLQVAAAAGISSKDFDITRDYDKLSYSRIVIKKDKQFN